ncbi:hypothetical protein PV10_04272 [Exophiala mesophila]|uniref:PPIase cyclophilin-type domain-containing protein n=1 Tax=Exophiala mesophila TaxID=212818 RepID=A0A0D1ZEC1_EXOME|nr:uncharacterized protein PV10_04272 [Exophiala mesophila]KIV93027.1 hypothetical protein PV10_04272 [Exophiala mesophila]
MSSHYTTEPPPTATVLLHTTAGPLTISLFATQTPLTCRNFLQHVLDEDYSGNLFHRVAPGFVIQTGDPTGTGEGGTNIYEDREFENYDDDWARVMGREKGEKIRFGDEIHSRLKFNRRGLVGMAKGSGDGSASGYGSQFFITLADCRAELDGKCTMFGRVEGEGIYNVVKVAEGELVEGTERPLYPEKILRAEIIEMPKGEAWQKMRKREKIEKRVVETSIKKKAVKKKAGKALLSFGGDDEGDDGPGVAVRPKKAKFNPNLIEGGGAEEDRPSKTNGKSQTKEPAPIERKKAPPAPPVASTLPQKRKASPEPTNKSSSASPIHHRKPSFHDPTTQLPLRNPESPSRSPTPVEDRKSGARASALQAEIEALKASMRRNVTTTKDESKHKKSALESLIPATSTRGRKRPRPGDSNNKEDTSALKMLKAFKARLDAADQSQHSTTVSNYVARSKSTGQKQNPAVSKAADANGKSSSSTDSSLPTKSGAAIEEEPKPDMDDTEEATLCDLHFIANCQSCSSWDKEANSGRAQDGADGLPGSDDDYEGTQWMSHSLSFAKDRLGKDLTWKKKNEEELVVIDPREKERNLKHAKRKDRDREREKDKERGRQNGSSKGKGRAMEGRW